MKPILFNTTMVKAILEGRKTQTRRIIKRTPSNDEPCGYGFWKEFNENDRKWYVKDYTHGSIWWTSEEYISKFSKYHVGDILWVRETWQESECFDWHIKGQYVYKADFEEGDITWTPKPQWRPSMHMPKCAARIFLKVIDVRIEKLSDMNQEDFIKEGIRTYTKDNKIFKYAVDENQYSWSEMPRNPQGAFKKLWNSTINKKDIGMYDLNSDPWVLAIEFERVYKNN